MSNDIKMVNMSEAEFNEKIEKRIQEIIEDQTKLRKYWKTDENLTKPLKITGYHGNSKNIIENHGKSNKLSGQELETTIFRDICLFFNTAWLS